MIVSVCGPLESSTAKKNFDVLRNKARASLKRFCLAPKVSHVDLFNEMLHMEDGHLQTLQRRWQLLATNRTGQPVIEVMIGYVRMEFEEVELKRIVAFHPHIDTILQTVNRHFCLEHPTEVLSLQHLASHGIEAGANRLFSQNKEERWEDGLDANAILSLKGERRWGE